MPFLGRFYCFINQLFVCRRGRNRVTIWQGELRQERHRRHAGHEPGRDRHEPAAVPRRHRGANQRATADASLRQ